MLSFNQLKAGQFIRIVKIKPDPSLNGPSYYPTAEVGTLLHLSGKTQMIVRLSGMYEPCWHGTDLMNRLKYIWPNAEDFEELSKESFEAEQAAEIKKQLAAGTLHIPTLTGHQVNTGSDPEIFVVNKQGVVIPAWEFLEAENHPFRAQNKLIPFWDGFQAEFNIDPGMCHAQRVDQVFEQLRKLLGLARAKFPEARLSSSAVLDIPPDVMKEISDKHAGLGCSPSKNLYGVKPLEIENPRQLPFRFAGFHIHFSCSNNAILKERIRMLDQIAGIISITLLRGVDDSRRRAYYGKAGEYRTPAHGLEWRVLSSTIMCHPILVNLMFDIARLAQGLPDGQYKDIWQVKGGDERVQHIINEYDDQDARAVIKENKGCFKAIINSLYGTARGNTLSPELTKKVETLILEGCREFLDPTAVEANWRLGNKQKWTGHSAADNESVATMALKGLK